MEFSIGDHVIIKYGLEELSRGDPHSPGVNSDMLAMQGQEFTITRKRFSEVKKRYIYNVSGSHWSWVGEWFEPVIEEQYEDIEESELMNIF